VARVAPPDDADSSIVRVFYGTDRSREDVSQTQIGYGAGRGAFTYGFADVSIPRDHRMGEIERPSIWRFEIRENPDRHVVIVGLTRESKDEFLDAVAARVAASDAKSAFVFVHGYNVAFPDAVRRTAQVAYDLAFDGPPILYSWPSNGALAAYTVDENNIEWTEPHLQAFLGDLADRSGATTIHLVAHSMGNRALTKAFRDLVRVRGAAVRGVFKDLILTAPDIDADVFRNQLVPALVAQGARVTLYASSRDRALLASKTVHGYPRAGDAGEGLVIMQGIDTVDASDVETDFLGHSYFGDNRSVIADLLRLIRSGEEPQRRGLARRERGSGVYWAFETR